MSDYEYLRDQIPIHHDLVSSFLLSAILIGMLISVVIFSKNKTKIQSLVLLSCFILLITVTNIDFYLCYTGVIKYVPWFFNSTEILVLLIGPILFLFLQTLLTGRKTGFKEVGFHVILPVTYFLTQVGYFLTSDFMKLCYYAESYDLPVDVEIPPATNLLYLSQTFNSIFIWLATGSALVYFLWSYKVIQNYNSRNKKGKSHTDKKFFSINLAILFITTFLFVFAFFTYSENDQMEFFIGLITSVILYVIAYFVIYESRYFNSSWLSEKYQTSGLSDGSKAIYLKTKDYLEENEYYLNRECSLQDLANRLSIPSNYISQSIHEIANKSFNDFINEYRIGVAKMRILDSEFQHLTQEGISSSVGFSSKTSFYNYFKKYTGMTPTQYKKQHNS